MPLIESDYFKIEKQNLMKDYNLFITEIKVGNNAKWSLQLRDCLTNKTHTWPQEEQKHICVVTPTV